MSRVKIESPESFHYKTEIQIGVNHLNYGNHLSNEQILVFAHEARLRCFVDMGVTEFDFWGPGLIQVDAEIVYQSEGHYRDLISVYLAFADFSRVGFKVNYRMFNETSKQNLAQANIGIVCFDYAQKKVKEVPSPFLEYINSLPKVTL